MQLNMLATELYGQYSTETGESLTKAFEDIYYKTIFDRQQAAGHGGEFGRISTHQIQAATSTAWKGKNYSERIWGDQRKSLARYVDRIVTSGVIQGSSNGEMTAQLQAAMNTHAYQARRLIRTEHSQVASKANLLAYQENETPRFQFRAVLDYRTSEICREMDGKVFLVSDGKVGINMPPLHPFCRSKTVPYRPDDELDADDTRVARNGSGETYQVPASMTYRDWYDAHVKGHADELLAEQKYKNGGTDAQQYAQYKSALGKKAPRTLDQFQNLKYTDPAAWDALKSQYRSQNYQNRKSGE